MALLLMTAAPGCGKGGRASDAGATAPPATLVETTEASRGERQIRRGYTGLTYPWEARGLGFLVAGRITTIEVEEGDWVEPGQLLATIQPDDYQLVEQLADVQVRALRPNYQRVSELVRRGALPDIKLDEIEGKYRAARTQKQQAERQVAYTRLEAPSAGVVMEKRAASGQVTGAGMPVLVVLDVDRIKAKFGVSQSDLACFREEGSVTVEIPGLAEPREGRIHHIAFVPDPRTRTYDVTVALDNPQRDIRAGMTARMDCLSEPVEGVFVPLAAVKRDGERRTLVLVVEEGVAHARVVEIGGIYGKELLVTSGLEGGEQVISKGQTFVRDGDPVRLLAKDGGAARPGEAP